MKRLSVCLGTLVLAVATPGVAQADTWALLLGGKGQYANLTEEQMSTAFGGYFAQYDHRVSLPFPGSDDFITSTKVGADNLYAAVYDPKYAGPKTIGGVSEGAPAVFEVLRRIEADRAAGKPVPDKSQLNVAVYGMPSGPFLGGYKVPKVVSPYDIIIVKAEYDGIADFPDNPLNLLAVTNALMGADQLHVKQAYFDIRTNPTEYSIVTNSANGTTTTILIPTAVLPILAPMVAAGASPATIAKMDKMLRPIIDRAYKRPPMTYGIPPTLTGPPSSATPPTTGAATVPTSVLASVSTGSATAPSGSATAAAAPTAPKRPALTLLRTLSVGGGQPTSDTPADTSPTPTTAVTTAEPTETSDSATSATASGAENTTAGKKPRSSLLSGLRNRTKAGDAAASNRQSASETSGRAASRRAEAHAGGDAA
jgi:3'-(hydroxy)phthioceranyl-2'-palmitoyl(stearoyl)-2-O-sulfo-trehalose (hydroxy)phthioceranyltransferase